MDTKSMPSLRRSARGSEDVREGESTLKDLDLPRLINDRFEPISILGEGSFG
jgi:serine/threonine protein kinase